MATPHSQRSIANVKVKLNSNINEFDVVNLINTLEGELKTPVQAAVKREDEQEFARINAKNLLFCEDAARRIKHVLQKQKKIKGFWLRVHHHESLHPHDATAEASSD